jgi:DNA helicase-2/ATP-dependent DNA helicase PcrA
VKRLTENQRKAITHGNGPALVVAGPGSGKTLVLTERVKFLIEEKNVPPDKIIVTTFTEKAANELKVRLSRGLGTKAARVQISTIHSLCNTLLHDYFTEHDMGIGYEVLDENAQRLLLHTNKFKLGIYRRDGYKFRWLNRGNLEDFADLYDFLTRNDVDVDNLKKELAKKGELSKDNEGVIDSYNKYIKILENENRIDFANIQLKFFKLISKNKELLEEVRNRFEYLLVDEYQDTSPLQDKIFRLIAPPQNNIFLVGDINQSIYGFRGATTLNFQNFTNTFPDSKIYFLNINFRSTENIVELSNTLMRDKIEKELESRRRKGEKSVLLEGETADEVAEKTVSLIEKMKDKGIIEKYGDVALLFRCWRHSDEYVKYLENYKIPYIVFGGGGLLDREEITTLVYLLSYVTQKLYLGEKFRKWIWWDIESFQNEVLDLSFKTQTSLDHLPQNMNIYDFKNKEELNKVGILEDKDIEKILRLNQLRRDVEESPKSYSLLEIYYKILEYSGYLKRLLEENNKESEEKLNNLAELSRIIGMFERMPGSKVEDFLWFIYFSAEGLNQRKVEDENTVKVMTVHKAKGLEFPVVFLCSLVEGRFPLNFRDSKYLIPIPKKFYMCRQEYKQRKQVHYEEERRLFYVGITRAQDNLIFTTSNKIKVQNKERSRFLKGIEEYISEDEKVDLPIEQKYKLVRDIPSLNYSAINTYIDCPFRYKLYYKYGFVSPWGFLQSLGIFVHNILQRIHKEMKENVGLNEEDIKEFVDEYWIPVHKEKSKDKKVKNTFMNKIKNYYNNARNFYKEIISIEEPFVYVDDNMVMGGRIDLIVRDNVGKTNLIDFKARESIGIEYTNVDKQLKIYNYCLRDKYSIDKLIAYTFMDNKMIEFEPEYEAVKNFLLDMSEEMKGEKFSKKKSLLCKECTFQFCC